MNQSDRTGVILLFITLLVAGVFGLTIGVEDHFDIDRFIAALTPDFGVLFGSDVVAGAVLFGLFGVLVLGAKFLVGP
ncbi:hypothetical protein E6P09_11925 [Haloferax mediterranei ATCC 33500]|uniref:Uncharacterized protein n=1 Tax=Haloferax mediterranei (strain ATCC 33500 / DSM 1411 / JCM 8866 / NBRC 14739 / NCIMB 2177 / R-4) TaxID=523841 RepID=I3R5H3_HALMT|nr:hypothetical protein [Haloferax mediterranei]AFK19483.1 hypothetical protein HFX_1778 [Haloferax mediterranei ATCC 33500]AHZ21172.1 hypothetical protein BM92_00215 [Haloferax mediterranei ATCC 33500]EMA04329.1 hypothetical protein C439_01602 [Haloferax mediterranei ATCC 33500]MDX5989586.1 hypothetical protein [Haloferax mediterranei ATCC 33500]QCQ75944.1 hypothetical protein E6P09_11925 [Haloferax mediterranei ATCC 33500]